MHRHSNATGVQPGDRLRIYLAPWRWGQSRYCRRRHYERRHLQTSLACGARRLKKAYPDLHISEDKQVKFLNALCFVSDDPDIYINANASPLAIPAHPPDEEAPLPEVSAQQASDFDPVELTRALTCIPADDHDDWIAVGQALHSTGDPLAKGLWDWWSERSAKFQPTGQGTGGRALPKTADARWAISTPWHISMDGGGSRHRSTMPRSARTARRGNHSYSHTALPMWSRSLYNGNGTRTLPSAPSVCWTVTLGSANRS